MSENDLVEHVQYEAARVVTGAIKGTSSNSLLKELAWVQLSMRRKIHQLTHMYKIVSNMTPLYLSELLPSTVGQRSNRSLRQGYNLSLFPCRTERFKQSFFPSIVSQWNSLELNIRNSRSLQSFKNEICSKFCATEYNKLFNFSVSRTASIWHARLRLGHCALNDSLYKINCSSTAMCDCNLGKETVLHYFLVCPRYAAQRVSLLASAADILGNIWVNSSSKQKLNCLLNGSKKLNMNNNCRLFSAVQRYIVDSKRF